MSFLNKKLSHLKAYVPGEQLCDREYIKLNTNESPFPPSPLVAEAITKAELDNLKLYPDPTCRVLCEKAAEVYNIKKENVLFGNGSDEVLSYIFLAFCENGVVFPDISYGFYKVFAELYGIDYEKIPLDSDFKITAEKYFNKNKTIIIANPNAPTGLILSQKEIIEILQSNKNNVVIIDEAYIDFGGKSAIDLICDYKNLIVVQTFSKSRSLAGARLGMAFADEKIINDLIKIKYSTNPYNINRITQLAGCAALSDKEYFELSCKKIIDVRETFSCFLQKNHFFVLHSFANFLFVKHDYLSGEYIYNYFKENNILVRHFESDRISDFNRITIGTAVQMKAIENVIIKLNAEN